MTMTLHGLLASISENFINCFQQVYHYYPIQLENTLCMQSVLMCNRNCYTVIVVDVIHEYATL